MEQENVSIYSVNHRQPELDVVSFPSFTTSVKESYLHPYDQVTDEPCSDPRTSYRCMRHRYCLMTHFLSGVDFLFLSAVGPGFLFDSVVLSGSPTRRPTGRRWRRTIARGTSAVPATTRAETNVSVSNRGNLLIVLPSWSDLVNKSDKESNSSWKETVRVLGQRRLVRQGFEPVV